jgi:hypothetical protein
MLVNIETGINDSDKNNREQGFWTYYWINGGLYSKGYYINGKPTGLWTFHKEYDDSIITKKAFMLEEKNKLNQQGQKHGYWEHDMLVINYKNPTGGKYICARGYYINDKPIGYWETNNKKDETLIKKKFYVIEK